MVWMDFDSLIGYSVLPVIFILLWDNSLGVFFPQLWNTSKIVLRIMWSMPSLPNPSIAIFALHYSGGGNRCPCTPSSTPFFSSRNEFDASPEFGVPHPRSCFYTYGYINETNVLYCFAFSTFIEMYLSLGNLLFSLVHPRWYRFSSSPFLTAL